jgi:hypothetical protein
LRAWQSLRHSLGAINYEYKRSPRSHGQPNHKGIPFSHYYVDKTIKYCNCGTIKTAVIKDGGREEERAHVLKTQLKRLAKGASHIFATRWQASCFSS